MIRFADDFVIGFERKDEVECCLRELRERFTKFGLRLHDTKTRLIEFGRHAARRRKARGEGRPETFDFLGFTHRCGVTRTHGWYTIHRETIAKRLRATLAVLAQKLRQRRNWPLGLMGRWLCRVIQGWLNYHAVPGNMRRMQQFRSALGRLWRQQLCRRSQRSPWRWDRMYRLLDRYFPTLRVQHPYPDQRFRARLNAGTV